MGKALVLLFGGLAFLRLCAAENFTTACNGYYLEDDHNLRATCTTRDNVMAQRHLDLNGCLANYDGSLAPAKE
jgi:hypothetical protein